MHPIRHLLVAVDFDEVSERALDYALEMAAPMGARVTAAHVYTVPMLNALAIDVEYLPSASEASRLGDEARTKLDALAASHADRGTFESVLREGNVAEEICRLAVERGADLIVVGTHRRGLIERTLLGSVAQTILRDAPLPVLTVREALKKS